MKWIFITFIIVFSINALANPMDTYGFSSRGMALCNSITANAEGIEGAYYNPSSITKTESLSFGAGFFLVKNYLNADYNIEDNVSFFYQTGFSFNIPMREKFKDLLYAGFSILIPHSSIYKIEDNPASSPQFIFLNSSFNERLSIYGAIGLKIHKKFSLGFGLSLLPDINGKVNVDVSSTSNSNSLSVGVNYDLSPIAGILFSPFDFLNFAITYRAGHKGDIDIPVYVNVSEKVPEINLRIYAPFFEVPHQISTAIALNIKKNINLTSDITWKNFSTYKFPSPSVFIYGSENNIEEEILSPEIKLHDTFTPSFGIEWKLKEKYILRGGYSYIPSPVPYQGKDTNILDPSRHLWGIGISFLITNKLRLDYHFQFSYLVKNSFEKEIFEPENPGFPAISSSGYFFNWGFMLKAGI